MCSSDALYARRKNAFGYLLSSIKRVWKAPHGKSGGKRCEMDCRVKHLENYCLNLKIKKVARAKGECAMINLATKRLNSERLLQKRYGIIEHFTKSITMVTAQN